MPITMEDGNLVVPNNPIVYYIEGDGIGVDITPVMIDVVDAAVKKAYAGEKKISWSETLAGEKAFNQTGEWLPEATLDAMRTGLVSIKGPLTTPVGGGIRSLNVALRQKLDLFACVRPVRWYEGTPSPVRSLLLLLSLGLGWVSTSELSSFSPIPIVLPLPREWSSGSGV